MNQGFGISVGQWEFGCEGRLCPAGIRCECRRVSLSDGSLQPLNPAQDVQRGAARPSVSAQLLLSPAEM